MQIFLNSNLSDKPTNLNDYLKIIDSLEKAKEGFSKNNPMNSVVSYSIDLVKKFPFETLKDISLLDDKVVISYDCARENPDLGTYGAIVNIYALDFKAVIYFTYYKTARESIHPIQLEKHLIDKKMNTMKTDCLLETMNYFETKNYFSENKIDDKVLEIGKAIYSKINNNLVQVVKPKDGKRGMIMVISPQEIPKRNSSKLWIYDTGEYIAVLLFDGIANVQTELVLIDKRETNIDNIAGSITSELRKRKILLYSYKIGFLSKKLSRTTMSEDSDR